MRDGAHRYDHHGGAVSPGSALASRHQSLQLGDVARLELVERGDAEQAHRAGYLLAEDLDSAVDALAPAGHEAVEVGAADEGESRLERDRGVDVGARRDFGAEVHLVVGADLAHELELQVE